jgi:hypothetical protein
MYIYKQPPSLKNFGQNALHKFATLAICLSLSLSLGSNQSQRHIHKKGRIDYINIKMKNTTHTSINTSPSLKKSGQNALHKFATLTLCLSLSKANRVIGMYIKRTNILYKIDYIIIKALSFQKIWNNEEHYAYVYTYPPSQKHFSQNALY